MMRSNPLPGELCAFLAFRARGLSVPRMASVAGAIERPLMRALEYLAAALVMAEVAILLVGVIARYVFRHPLIWTDDHVAEFLTAFASTLGRSG